MTQYLTRMRDTWKIVAVDCQVDVYTVQALEGRCPFCSTEDRDHIEAQMQQGRIFSCVKSQSQRSLILQIIISIPYTITSLYTFFEGLKCLHPCVKVLREMLPSSPNCSILQSFDRICRAVFGPSRSAEPEPELSRTWAGETQGLGIAEQIGGLGSHIRDRPQRHRHTESSALAHTHTHRTIYCCYI
jgi:hypothetical protein